MMMYGIISLVAVAWLTAGMVTMVAPAFVKANSQSNGKGQILTPNVEPS